MITSDKQYEAAKEKLAMLKQSLLAPTKNNVPDAIAKASMRQVQELMDEIQKSIDEYVQLTENKTTAIEIHSLDDLFSAPIRYRLSTHMTLEGFGQKVGVSARQIARYEKEEYRNINTSTLNKILGKLEVNINGRINKEKNNEPKMGKSF